VPAPTEAPARRILYTLSLGHLVVDLNSGAVAALLPLIEVPFHLSVAALTLLVALANAVSSIIQPLFGLAIDRTDHPWIMPGGLVIASVGTMLVGQMPTYGLLVGAVCIAAVGVAMYHPEASRVAYLAAGPMRASAMSIFSAGGNLGFALGPVFMAGSAALLGLPGTALFLVPGALALIVFAVVRPAQVMGGKDRPKGLHLEGENRIGPVVLVMLVVIFRSALIFGTMSLVPLFLVSRFHMDPHLASALDFLFLFAGALGTVLGGPFSDRHGRRSHLLVAFVLALPLVFAMPRLPLLGLLAAMAVMGFLVVSTFATTVTLTQELLPHSVGVASALAVGLGVGVGGLLVLLLGHIADHVGIFPVLSFFFVLPTLCIACTLPLSRRVLTA